MIVDCHTHVHEYPGHLSDEFVREAQARSRSKPMAVDVNVTTDRHWKAMGGVDKVIVLGMRAFHSGIMVPNEYVADYVSRHPEKVIGFAGVDPTRDNVRKTLEVATDKLKLRGVKLGPVYQNVHPTDKRIMEVYEFCEARKLPILIHQGTTFPRLAPLKYSLPILLEDVALQFPELRMVIAHLGHPWVEDTLVLIRKQPNLYADLSALHYRTWQFYNSLILAKEYGVLGKVLFGTDYPYTTPEATIEALRNFNKVVDGTNLPRLEVDDIEKLIHSPTLEYLGLS